MPAQASPQRIISLAPSVTASLYELGVDSRVIAVTEHCVIPPAAIPKQRIGGMWNPNIELIASLHPDLVVATKEGNLRSTVDRLDTMGIRTLIIGRDADFGSICGHFTALGKTMGVPGRAAEIIAAAHARVDASRRLTSTRPPVRVFWVVGARPLCTISDGSFLADMTRLAGGINVYSGMKVRYPRVSREDVLRRDPDAVLIASMGDVSASEKTLWLSYSSLSASVRRRVYLVNDLAILTPTPTTFARGVAYIATLLHPQTTRDIP